MECDGVVEKGAVLVDGEEMGRKGRIAGFGVGEGEGDSEREKRPARARDFFPFLLILFYSVYFMCFERQPHEASEWPSLAADRTMD